MHDVIIDNATILLFSVATTNLNLIIPFLTAILVIVVGYFLTKHHQKSNNQREKAKEITKEFRENFLEVLNKQIEIVENFQYLTIQETPFKITSRLDEVILKNYLVNTGLFRMENGRLYSTLYQRQIV